MSRLPGRRVCVTGATGFVGSCLVRLLLRRGYHVHATARDTGKAMQMLSSLDGSDRLTVFQADFSKKGSFDEAVQGCTGVFHLAVSMEFATSSAESTDDHVRTNILQPAVTGTINLLQACERAGTVKRIIFTASIANITAEVESGGWKSVVDESCVRSIEAVWKTKPSGWIYVLLKHETEREALKFCLEKRIDLVTVILPTVAGPFLTPDVPASVQVLLSPVTGDLKYYQLLISVYSRFASLPLAHVEDVCDAYVLVFESRAANGRYFCCNGSSSMSELAHLLSTKYPSLLLERLQKESVTSVPSIISVERIWALGHRSRHSLGDIVSQTVAACEKHGFLKQMA